MQIAIKHQKRRRFPYCSSSSRLKRTPAAAPTITPAINTLYGWKKRHCSLALKARERLFAGGKEKKQKKNRGEQKITETRRKEKHRSNAETRIGSAIVFIPVEKRTTQKLSSTESLHLHHLLSSFIIQEVVGKRKQTLDTKGRK